ncbi:MAG: enoyl-CoA hydratase/isomerase family protein [Bacteroidales bacterium]|nr:MAG: enoyl-CoA hydratase/isomerase family protein [Bacteroidales bacterium]
MSRSVKSKLSREGPVGLVIIDNNAGNVLDEPEFLRIDRLQDFISTESIKSIVISGKGRHFSSGANLQKLLQTAENKTLLEETIRKGRLLLDFIEGLEIPVIAAIEGVCFGGGLEIALACHIRICSENALFAFPEVNHNLIPGLGGIGRATRILKGGMGYEMVLGGDMFDAATAYELRIIDHIVPKGNTLEYSVGLLKKLVKDKPLEVINAVVRAIKVNKQLNFNDAMVEETRMFCDLAFKEALRRKEE